MNFKKLNCENIDFESWINNNDNDKKWASGSWTARV